MRSVCLKVTADGVGIGTLNWRSTRFFAGFRNRNALYSARATRGDPVKRKTGRRTESRPETFYGQSELFAFTNAPSWYLSLSVLLIHRTLYAWFSAKPKVFPSLIFRIFLTLCELPYFCSYQVAEATKIHHQFENINFECRHRGRTAISRIFIANRAPRFVNIPRSIIRGSSETRGTWKQSATHYRERDRNPKSHKYVRAFFFFVFS